MPPTSSPRPAAAEPPLALLLASEGGAPPHAARLERAGFALRYCRTPGEARRLAASAALCDAALLDSEDLSQRSMEQLVRDRLEALLDRLGEESVAGLHALVMREVERGLLRLVLDRCHGHKSEAARQLGLHRNTLRQKVAELGLATPGRKRR